MCIFRRHVKKHHLKSEILPVLRSRSKQSCDSTGSMWQIKCHKRTSSMVYLIYSPEVPLWTSQLFPAAAPVEGGPDTHIQEAGGLQAVLLAPQQQLQPFQAPVRAFQRVWNICSEKRQGEILPRMRLAQIHIESRTEQPSNMRFMLKSHFENQEPTASLGLCHMSWFNPGSPTQQSRQATGLMVKQVRLLLSWVMHVVWG